MNLKQAVKAIEPLDGAAMSSAVERYKIIAKPLKSLGIFEGLVCKLAGIFGDDNFSIDKKCVVVMCADNGVVAQNVSQTGSEITALVAEGFVLGTSTVCKLAEIAGADVFPFDVGIAADIENPKIRRRKSANGTKDFTEWPAMTRQQLEDTINFGIEVVGEMKDAGYNIIATGEMGIANTTTSSACAAVLLNMAVEDVTGPGAGLSAEGVKHKVDVIKKGIDINKPDAKDPLDVIMKVGGFDIAALVGVFLGGAVHKIPIVIDGLISSIAAVVAQRICPYAADYMLASHLTREPAGAAVMKELKLRPFIYGEMHLGEGTGAVMSFPILDMMVHAYKTMPTFADILMDNYKPL